DRDLGKAEALRQAASRAYRMAGIAHPAREIDVAEISARYAYEELMAMEALGLSEAPQDTLARRECEIGGQLPINPSGGPLCGNPVTVSGLVRVVEAYLQLTDQAGAHQVHGARTALAHGAGGICGQNQSVVILRRE
ncbi:MAG: thiolase family protein, partial [Acidobacteria bacterium]